MHIYTYVHVYVCTYLIIYKHTYLHAYMQGRDATIHKVHNTIYCLLSIMIQRYITRYSAMWVSRFCHAYRPLLFRRYKSYSEWSISHWIQHIMYAQYWLNLNWYMDISARYWVNISINISIRLEFVSIRITALAVTAIYRYIVASLACIHTYVPFEFDHIVLVFLLSTL